MPKNGIDGGNRDMNRLPSLMIAGCVGMKALNNHGVSTHRRTASPTSRPNMSAVPVHTTRLARFRRSPPKACPIIVEMASDRPSIAMKLMLIKRSPMPYAESAIVALETRPMMPVRTRKPNGPRDTDGGGKADLENTPVPEPVRHKVAPADMETMPPPE